MSTLTRTSLRRSCTCRISRSAASGATRNYATTPEEAASSTPAAAYPFSSQLQIIKSSFSSASKRTDSSHTLMHRINTHLSATAAQTDPTLAARLALFSRANRHRRAPLASPGSILTVKFYTNASRTQTNTFSGVLIAVRRRGVDTCFRLRNVLNKCGVEMMFNASSNMLADIEVVSRADLTKRDKARPGRMVRFRRAKLYYMRTNPNTLPNVGSAVRAAEDRAERQAAKAAPKLDTTVQSNKQKKKADRKAARAEAKAAKVATGADTPIVE